MKKIASSSSSVTQKEITRLVRTEQTFPLPTLSIILLFMATKAQKANVGGVDDREATIRDEQTHVADDPRAIATTELRVCSILTQSAELVNAKTKKK